jgi:hypothetical protein
MRTVNEIKKTMTERWMSDEKVAKKYGFAVGTPFDDRFAKASPESIIFYISAMAMFVIYGMFDLLRRDVDAELSQRLTHNLQWYANIAKEFQYGDALNPETGKYDVTDEKKRIVEYSAVEDNEKRLVVKVAKSDGDDLAKLSVPELTAFTEYMQQVKDAGVRIVIVSEAGDLLNLTVDILYDPLVLDGYGNVLGDSGEPVRESIKNYIKNLPFNGEFTIQGLTDALQAAQGVKIATVRAASSKFAGYDRQNIDVRVKPGSGYMVLNELIVKYDAY